MKKLERALFRSLARLAKQFDSHAVKALICRQHGNPLPPGLDAVVARFLDDPDRYRWPPRRYYWPPARRRQHHLLDTLRDAWRDPVPGATLEDAFAGVRYLTGVLAVARKHGLLAAAPRGSGDAAGAAAQRQAGQPTGSASCRDAGAGGVAPETGPGTGAALSRPGRGAVLLAHPCQPGSIFSRSVVLLCRDADDTGCHGLILNKPLGSSLKDLHEKLRQLRGGLPVGSPGSPGGIAVAAAAAAAQPGRTSAEGAGDSGGGSSEDDDIPADLLQRLVDDKAAALQAVLRHALQAEWQRRGETDESGNWVEPPYQSESESEGEEEEEAGLSAAWSSDEEGSGSSSDDEGGPAEGQGGGPTGVLSTLGEALRSAGGGTIVMLGPGGQVWAQHMVPGDQASDDEEEGRWTARHAAHGGDGPWAVADLLLRCLTPADRQLLRAQHHAARQQQRQQQQQRRQGAVERSDSPSGEGAWEAGRARGLAVSQPPSRGGSSSSSSSSTSSFPGASRAQRLQSALGSLVQQTLSGAAAQPSAPRPTAAAFTHPPGGGSEGGTSDGSSGEGRGAGRAPLSELMALFADSPLFRGGPVPGLEVLHCRPRLGGELLVPPAAEPAGAGVQAGGDGELEGGIFRGADLARAQALVAEGYLSPWDVRVCMGDSAWEAGQLEEELEAGLWAVARVPSDVLDAFGPAAAAASTLGAGGSASGEGDAPAEAYEGSVWANCLSALGPEYAELARVPRGAWEDLAGLEV